MPPLTTIAYLLRYSSRPYLWPFIWLNTFCFGWIVSLPPTEILLVGTSLCMCASYGFLVNDVFDREGDRVNLVERLQGFAQHELRLANILTTLLAAVSLVTALAADGIALFVIVLCLVVSLFLYSWIAKRLVFLATLLVAASATSPLWIPLILAPASTPLHGLWGVTLACSVLIFARELAMDIRDQPGDRTLRRMTFPIAFGDRVACSLVFILTIFGSGGLLAIICTSSRIEFEMTGLIGLLLLGTLWWSSWVPAVKVVAEPTVSNLSLYISRARLCMAVVPLISVVMFGR